MAMSERFESESPWVWDDLDRGRGQPGATESTTTGEAGESTHEDLVDEAFRMGHERGFAEGQRSAAEELDTALTALSTALRSAEEIRETMLSDLSENTAALALGVARELIVSELDRAPETVAELVREAVASFALDQPLSVRLNPTDLALITGGGDTVVSGSREVRWEPDPTVGRGGCLVEGPGKIVDGRLDLALERIYRVVSGA